MFCNLYFYLFKVIASGSVVFFLMYFTPPPLCKLGGSKIHKNKYHWTKGDHFKQIEIQVTKHFELLYLVLEQFKISGAPGMRRISVGESLKWTAENRSYCISAVSEMTTAAFVGAGLFWVVIWIWVRGGWHQLWLHRQHLFQKTNQQQRWGAVIWSHIQHDH